MTEWRCTNGHDRCFNTTPGPDCPMCERDDTVEDDEDDDDFDYDEDDGDALASAGFGTDEDYGPPPGGDDD